MNEIFRVTVYGSIFVILASIGGFVLSFISYTLNSIFDVNINLITISLNALFQSLFISSILFIISIIFWYSKFKSYSDHSNSEFTLSSENWSDLAIIIPAFNEEKNILKVIESFSKYTKNIIVIDDYSSDKTSELVKSTKVTLIQHPSNMGVGAAIKTGYRFCLDQKFKYITVVAGDGQHDSSDLINLYRNILNNNSDYVIGVRLFPKYDNSQMPFLRKFGNFLLSYLTSASSARLCLDSQSGYTIIRTNVLTSISWNFISNRWGIPNDIFFEVIRNNFHVSFNPIKSIYGGRESYIRMNDFILRVGPILLKGLINTSLLKPGPSGGLRIIFTLLLISSSIFYYNPYFIFIIIAILLISLILTLINQSTHVNSYLNWKIDI